MFAQERTLIGASDVSDRESEPGRAVFATTHWSVVLATTSEDSPQAAAALEQLCRTYWYPLYAYIRRRGYGHEDAQTGTSGSRGDGDRPR